MLTDLFIPETEYDIFIKSLLSGDYNDLVPSEEGDDEEEEEEGVFIPNSSTIHEAFDTFQDVLNENEVNLRDFMSTLVSKTMSSSSSQR